MRIILNILAALCAFFCCLAALLCLLAIAIFVLGPRAASVSIGVWLAMVGTLTGLGAGSLFGAFRMARHLRRPDQTTAKQVFMVTTLLLGLELISLIHGRSGRAAPIEYFSTAPDGLGSVAVIVALFLLYRLVLKTVATQTFSPPNSNS